MEEDLYSSVSVPLEIIDGKETFPLKLSGMELFWLWDDSPEYPKRFRIAMRFVGTIDWNAWNKAIRTAAARHPLLLAHLEHGRWVLPTSPKIFTYWNKGTFERSPFPEVWDLEVESGMRLWGGIESGLSNALDEQPFLFVIECHHSVCDGLGIRQFSAEWLLIYDQLIAESDSKVKLVRLDPSLLSKRGEIRRKLMTKEPPRQRFWEPLKLALGFLFCSPKKLQPRSHTKNSKPSDGLHHFRMKILSPAETAAGLDPQNDCSANFNDVAVAAMLKTVHDWNHDSGSKPFSVLGKPTLRFRVMIPTDLRSLQDMRMTAANRIGFGFAVADSLACVSPKQLLNSVAEQTLGMHRFGLGWDFPEIFGLLTHVPWLGKLLVKLPFRYASAVVTNMGDVTRRHRRQVAMEDLYPKCGNLKLQAIFGVPPLKHGTAIGVGLCRCGDTIAIGMILDGRQFGSNEADELLERYTQSIKLLSKV